VALGACYDKGLVRSVAHSLGIPVPAERYLEPGTALAAEVTYPAFLKPNRGDGSLGIHPESIVGDRPAAERCLARLREEVPGEGLLVQQLLPGGEYSIGVIGNPGAGFTFPPALEVDYSALPSGLPRLLDYGSKTDPDSPYWQNVRFRRAELPAATLARLETDCARLFARLGLRDYARFDFRADAEGEVRLMEVNPNPAWCHDGKLAHMVAQEGHGHAHLLDLIIDAAWRRCFG